VNHVLPQIVGPSDDGGPTTLLRVGGANLMRPPMLPAVSIGGRPVGVVRASERELLLAPQAGQMSGDLVVEPEPGRRAVLAFDLRSHWREASREEEPSL
jgi:hypothetical protein